jgi:small conductance mechanosensitive channel
MDSAMNFVSGDSARAGGGAAEAGELIRTTGERVETSFWDALNGLLLKIPDLLGFALALFVGWLVGRLIARALFRRFDRRGRTDLGRLLGAIAIWLSVLVAGLLALGLLFPGIDPTNILSLLGIGSIALGFAFKDILQNLVAGVILLVREPYKKGDEIIVGDGDYEGVVEEVETRATHIRTIDRRMVVIPNVMIFTSAITVNTDCAYRMTNYTLSISYGGDPRRAMEVVLEAIRSAEGVRPEPAPAVAITSLNDSSIDLYLVYAAGPSEPEQIKTKGAVLLQIHDACRANGIALPFPTQLTLLHPSVPAADLPDKLQGSSDAPGGRPAPAPP